MANQEMQPNPVNELLAEFSTRLNEVEEKQRLIKDRALLIGKNLITTKEDNNKQFTELKLKTTLLEDDIKALKQLNKRSIEELGNLARKTEVRALQKQMKMFEPLELVRMKDIRRIIKEELMLLKNKSIKKKNT